MKDQCPKCGAPCAAIPATPQAAEEPFWQLLNAVTEELNRIAAPGVYLTRAHAIGSKFITELRPTPTAAIPAAPSGVTDAMVDAYLKANDAYWRRTDELPQSGTKWRNGNPREATRESLIAALTQPTTVQQAPTDEELAAAAYKGFDDYWTEDCAVKESEAWLASAKAVLALKGMQPGERKDQE